MRYEYNIATGETTEHPDAPATLQEPLRINQVSMRQARLALLQFGLLAQVQGAIDSLPSPQKDAAQIEWECASDVERDSPLVQMLAPALGLTKEQVDELFTEASKL